jgi:hypothetical protein
MAAFIGLLRIAQVIGGIIVYFIASPAAVMVGMGVIGLGLGYLLERADRQIELLENIKART